jgi:hypothetical protein
MRCDGEPCSVGLGTCTGAFRPEAKGGIEAEIGLL